MGILAGAAVWPVVAHSQQPGRVPTIGFLGASAASSQAQWTAAFVQRLRELGWVEDRTVTIEFRFAEGRNDRFAELAAEFVRLKVDVILTDGGATLAAKNVTSTIPIVFAVAADPLGGGYVSSLSRPVATSPDRRCKRQIPPPNVLACCARQFPVSSAWRS